MSVPTLRERTSGVLLHLSSLPGPHGIGDLGLEARAFADFLARAGQRWWQMLPVGPLGFGDSPYSARSAFAGNPLFVDLDAFDLDVGHEPFSADSVDYSTAFAFRMRHLRAAFAKLGPDELKRYRDFCEREARWLDDFALFDALKRAHREAPWWLWEADVRDRRPEALAQARRALETDITFTKQAQWAFDEQWSAFHAYCTERGIGLIGDLPIFVAHDSADVWQHRELFDLDHAGLPRHIAGVPPDYFSATGQRWGNPLYRWKVIAKSGYAWWIERFATALRRFDAIRLDHFIGFARYWRIPAHEPTAVSGLWMRGPGRALFDAVARAIGTGGKPLPLIAEDLGAVTRSVRRLRRELGLPGIRLVQFAFGSDPQAPAFLPHNHEKSSVVYTGTHDNDTSVGWFTDPGGTSMSSRTREEADDERHRVLAYMGRQHGEPVDVSLEMMRLAMASVARTCIVPLQDVLGLGTEARMNRPGTASGNWRWRARASALSTEASSRLLDLARTYGRATAQTE
ncbi:MAG TPA: 4-alpha-glucanotransferase [Labilithrix sp.]|nr:4-alpha-glucanotransferase [Labilithrix sp.]